MAKKAKTRKLTRRDAVTLLGAGTVMGVARTPLATAGEVVQKDPKCDNPCVAETYSKGSVQLLVSYSCCEETRNAIFVGVQDPKGKPNQRGKDHLKPVQTRLNYDTLLEYCFMIWGIDEAQAKVLFNVVPKTLDISVDKRGPAAK